MQNRSTGMFATSVPVDVVPSAPRCPSWKIHTSAPNAAVSDNTLHASAVSGRTTLPVSRNNSANVITAIKPSTSGSHVVMAATLSWLIWAVPVISTARPAGPGTSCRRSSCASELSENSGALLPTVRNALPSATPAAAAGGPTLALSTKVPVGADTWVTSGTCDNAAAYRSRSAGGNPWAAGTTTVTAVSELFTKLLRSWSPT